MKLTDQVVSLEQAKRLKELGVKNDNILFAWVVFCPDPIGEHYSYEVVYRDEESQPAKYGEYLGPAFTVSELGVMLLAYSPIGHSFYIDMGKTDGKCWAHSWSNKRHQSQGIISWHKTEASARAAMLIHLLENNLLSVEEVNQRLEA